MSNIYRISGHAVSGDTITFFHKVRDEKFVDGKGIVFGDEVEKEWFKLRVSEDVRSEFSLTSNSRIYCGIPSCSEREVMDYFRRAKVGKLISSRKLVNYDEDPYGRVVENGFYDYEIWDISSIFNN